MRVVAFVVDNRYKTVPVQLRAVFDSPGPEPVTLPPVEKFLPLKPVWFHVLLAVAAGDRHGYAIRKRVEARTDGRLKLWPTTLYGTLHSLAEEGLLAEVCEEQGGRQRRMYRLTDLGEQVLAAETARLEELVEAARGELAGRETAR